MSDKNEILYWNEDNSRNGPPEDILHYSVYTYNAVTDDGLVHLRSFIVLKNDYGVIVKFTRLHLYAGVYSGRTVVPLTKNPTKRLYYISAMLNYILVYNYDKYRINHVFQITKEMLTDFFQTYALEPKSDGNHKQKDTVENCINAVTRFMAMLAKKYKNQMHITLDELYVSTNYYDKYKKKRILQRPDFQISIVSEVRPKFKDLPTKAFELLIPLAFKYSPEIAFALCIQAFAGLRAGEVMNMRQETSISGGTIQFTSIAGTVIKIEINLKKALVMRKDNKIVGSIKKPRMQCVYPAFIDAFCTAYKVHMQILKNGNCDEDYKPLFPNRDGNAMTTDDYRKTFMNLVKNHFCPLLLESSDPELRIYGQLLCENSLTPHSLRHWFTVQLVLRGEDIAGIQFWRGDRNPQSAFEYLQNKGDLVKELIEADDKLTKILLKVGEQNNG